MDKLENQMIASSGTEYFSKKQLIELINRNYPDTDENGYKVHGNIATLFRQESYDGHTAQILVFSKLMED